MNVRTPMHADPGFAANFRALCESGLDTSEVAFRLKVNTATAYKLRKVLGVPLPDRTVAPCSMCGTPRGYVPSGQVRPARLDATRHGGKPGACRDCYDTARQPGIVTPCCRCGTEGGYIRPGRRKSGRYAVAWEGGHALACRACYDDLRPFRAPEPERIDVHAPAEVMADTLAVMAGRALEWRKAADDPAGGTWHAVDTRPADASPVEVLLAAWRADTDGGRAMGRPWGRVAGAVGLGKVVNEEDEG